MTRAACAPALSVVVPARDEERLIGACLRAVQESILNAGLVAETIVVDDGSRDQTAAVARAAGAMVISHEVSSGPLAAWMSGVQASSAGLVVFVDADCEVEPHAFERLLAAFADPDVGVGAARAVPRWTPGFATWVTHSARFSAEALHQVKRRLSDHDFVPIGRLFAIRRAAWRVGDPSLTPCDRVVARKAREGGWKVRYVPDAVVTYELVTSLSQLRADHRRTHRPTDARIDFDRLPVGELARGWWVAALRAPFDAMAWSCCRIALWAVDLGRGGVAGPAGQQSWTRD